MLKFTEFDNFLNDLKKQKGFKTTIKEEIFNPVGDYGKIIVNKATYNKIKNKNKPIFILNVKCIYHGLVYELIENNTILFKKL